MISKNLAVGMWLAGSAALSGCVQSADTETSETDAGEAALALVKTPPPVPQLCTANVSHTGHATRLYWSSTGLCSTVTGVKPLVVMINGNGYGYADYDYLLQHLVANGFIAVSIHRSALEDGDSLVLAGEVRTILEDYVLGTSAVAGHVDPEALGLVGHSYGGNAVRVLAQQLASDPLFAVKAVVTLAQNGEDTLFLDGTMTRGYLGLHGTNDSDRAPWETYRHFDKAGAQASQLDPAANPAVLSKAMKLLVGAAHGDFADHDPAAAPTLLGDEVRDATKGYVRSFLQLHLQGSSATYDDLIRGDGLPPGWEGQQTFSQYRHGGQRRTIDNFEDGELSNNSFLLPTISNASVAQVLSLVPSDVTPHAHETGALELNIGADGQYVRSFVPSGAKRNASLFRWLSLRIGQTSGVAAEDVFVRVMNGGVWSDPPVRLTDHGVIPGTKLMLPGPMPVHHMGTVRIPLSEFDGCNNVSLVELSFSGDAVGASFLVDDVEFSENVFVTE